MRTMALVSIRLKHVSWRNGRPRFNPGPKLRRLGMKAEDLKRDSVDGEPGPWMTLSEAEAWVTAKEAEIKAARAARPYRLAHTPVGAAPSSSKNGRHVLLYTLADLFRDFLDSPLTGEDLKPRTLRDYTAKKNALEKFDPELFGAAAGALTQPILFALYQKLRAEKGVSMSRGMMVVLSAALSFGMLRGLVKDERGKLFLVNPAQKLQMKMPKPRIRVGEPVEMRALVAAADACGRPEIGDSVMLGLWTGQRQGDRIALVDEGLVQGRRVFRQSKTGEVVAIREAPELAARLAAARARRATWSNVALKPLVLMDEKAKTPWHEDGDHYRHVFAEVRAFAAKHCASLATFRDQDLRDTAVTWMALGGATIPEIIAVTGHTPSQAQDILKHYLGRHPDLADAAIGKMVTWYEKGIAG